jgi:hypothetical protein
VRVVKRHIIASGVIAFAIAQWGEMWRRANHARELSVYDYAAAIPLTIGAVVFSYRAWVRKKRISSA